MSHMYPVIPGNSHKPLPALSLALKFVSKVLKLGGQARLSQPYWISVLSP